MKQAILADQKISLRDVDIPEILANQILVRTVGCGVCEGDLFRYKESAGNKDASPFGHEASGIVEKVGSCVTQFSPGDRVSSMDGGYAEYFVSDEINLALVPESLPLESALGEPLACCVHAAEKFNIRLGDKVAVIGCGYMGLVSLQLALLQGASQVTAFDLMPWRLKDALILGADQALNASEIDPEGSVDWAASVMTPVLREQALSRAAREYARMDPRAYKKFIDSNNPSARAILNLGLDAGYQENADEVAYSYDIIEEDSEPIASILARRTRLAGSSARVNHVELTLD
jgi:threonine dehydrogenase-like Zn-dependent dehydrogenase